MLGETRSRQNVLGGRHDVHVLVEERSADVSRLVTVMEIFTEELLVKLWSTPLTDARAYLLDDANDERRKLRRPLIRYGDPQYWVGKGEGLMPYSTHWCSAAHSPKSRFSSAKTVLLRMKSVNCKQKI